MPAPRDRTPAAWLDRRCAPCFHHALLLQRAEPRRCDDPTTDPILTAVLAALASIQLDDEARALGLHREHIAAVHFALAALLDESAAQTPGSEPWREQLFTRAGLPRSASVGDEFFVDLERRLALPAPTPADLAVLQIHALCLLLGLRGRYGARIDASEADLQQHLHRLQLKLRPILAPRPPPSAPPTALRLPAPPPRTTLLAAALLLVFTLALLTSLHRNLGRHADTLRAHLGALP